MRINTVSKLYIIVFVPALIAAEAPKATPLNALESAFPQRTAAKARVTLAADVSGLVNPVDSLEAADSGQVPNYVRALAERPGAVPAFAHLFKSVLYDGTVMPEVKMAMGLRIAQLEQSPYLAAHLERLMQVGQRGRSLVDTLRAGKLDALPPDQVAALHYAEWLSPNVNGVNDEQFRTVRGYFSDSQIVELTLTVCFYEYFTRLVEGLNLPLEPWALNTKPGVEEVSYQAPIARIPYITDADMDLINKDQPALKEMRSRATQGLGLNIANSERAMLWCRDIPEAWWAYGRTIRQSNSLGRDVLLQVSFAVSMANGCRYCTLHQVLGLRRLGVDPAKLVAMRKDDSALTPKELAAVRYARKLTLAPSSTSDVDYQPLEKEFGSSGAFDVLLQTCTFAFMNHFTDVTRMPSEDIALETYREVYGGLQARLAFRVAEANSRSSVKPNPAEAPLPTVKRLLRYPYVRPSFSCPLSEHDLLFRMTFPWHLVLFRLSSRGPHPGARLNSDRAS